MSVIPRSTHFRHLLAYKSRAQAAYLILALAEQAAASDDDLLWLRRVLAMHVAVHREYKELLIEQGLL